MRLNHYVVLTASEALVEELHHFGIAVEAGHLSSFTMYRDDPCWHRVHELLADSDATIREISEYSEQEYLQSRYLRVRSGKEGGYPQPEQDSGWKKATYDLSRYCSACGTHAKQVNPFQMIGEPKFGRSDVVSLGWVHDQLFVRTEIWERVFEPFGIESLPVLRHTTQLPLETVVQLEIDEISPFPLDAQDKWESSVCSVCGQKKNCGSPRTPFFPHFAGNPKGHLFRTQEVFGAGWTSVRAVVCSNELYRATVSAGVRGFQFEPQETL